jgi:hypothetical protein
VERRDPKRKQKELLADQTTTRKSDQSNTIVNSTSSRELIHSFASIIVDIYFEKFSKGKP